MSAMSCSRNRSWLRSRSVSSMRKMNFPPLLRAQRWLKSAVRAFPRCSDPVGLGAKRVMTGVSLIEDISQDCTYSSRITAYETIDTCPRIPRFCLYAPFRCGRQGGGFEGRPPEPGLCAPGASGHLDGKFLDRIEPRTRAAHRCEFFGLRRSRPLHQHA